MRVRLNWSWLAVDTLARLHREGIRLWPGTDDATGFTVQRLRRGR
jgi:hypothetical protein